MKSLNAITLAVLAALPASALAQAQQQSKEDSRSNKVDETLVIQASPLNKTPLESAQPVNIISCAANLLFNSCGKNARLFPLI